MKTDSAKRFGLIGLGLIIIAFLVWAFVLPRFKDKPASQPSDQQLQQLTAPSQQPQSTPDVRTSDPPIPQPPAE